jgi:hypothetical protein
MLIESPVLWGSRWSLSVLINTILRMGGIYLCLSMEAQRGGVFRGIYGEK